MACCISSTRKLASSRLPDTESIRPVFVYGTLRPGEAGYADFHLSEKAEYLGPARVAGRLYDLGDYPGLLLGGPGSVSGDLLRPRDERLLAELDAYELFDPANPAGSEYLRVPAQTLDRAITIWIYVYNFPLETARPIVSGDWLRRLPL